MIRAAFLLVLPIDDVVVGVALDGPRDCSWLLSVDTDGVLWSLQARPGDRKSLVSWCRLQRLRVYASLGLLFEGLERGHCVGVVLDVAIFRWSDAFSRRPDVFGFWPWPGP